MNILITGATGFIGKNLLKSLEHEYNVFLLVRETTDLSGVNGYKYFCFKNNIEDLSYYIKENNIIGVVHLASLYIAQHKSEQIKDLVSSNVYLGAAIIEGAAKGGVKWFINTGTIWQNYIYNKEDYCPVNFYAATKQAFIDIAKYYTEVYPIKFATLKLCDTYGPNDTRRKIFSLFRDISVTGETLDMSGGDQIMDILYIEDVVTGFRKLIELITNKTNITIKEEYVLTAPIRYKLKELADIFSNVSGRKLNINWGGKKYREREVMIPWEKGTVLPNWKPSYSLEEGINLIMNNK